MAEPLLVAVVGHTNAGKTSLLRTLTRREGFGEVADRPGTTRHTESVDLRVDGRSAIRFFDTPGLEDSTGLLDALGPLRADMTPPQRLRAFLATEAAEAEFEQEAKVLRALLEVDAALYVIDCREPVVAKFRCEIEILASCGKPVLPVLNFVRDAAQREADWQKVLADFGLHALARFDAVAPFVGAEQRLYRDLQTLLPQRGAQLRQVADFLAQELAARREASLRAIAETLIDVTAARITLEREELDDAHRKAARIDTFRAGVSQRAQRGVQEVLEVHAFRPEEANLELLPWLDGRWEADLFNIETLREAGVRLGTGAAVGAGFGLAADAALGGLSLGAGAALGAAIGGAASQGFGAVGRRLANLAAGREDLTVEDVVIVRIAQDLLGLMLVLEERGHAATARIELGQALAAAPPEPFKPLLRALASARGQASWTVAPLRPRERAQAPVLDALRELLRTLTAAGDPRD